MANFFINRPVFAWVIAIILMMAGALSITNLPDRAISKHCATCCFYYGYRSRGIG